MCLIVTVNGSPSPLSRTGVLLRATAHSVSEKLLGSRVEEVSLAADWKDIFCALDRSQVTPRGEASLRTAEQADLLIVGSPIFRGSYTGLLKHYFDLVDREAMAGKTAVVAATGGSPLHGLAIEHQLRPLLGFFNIQTVATGLYGGPADFEDGKIQGQAMLDRIERASSEAASLLLGRRAVQSALEAAE
ncbi:NAD(P)H-dependent FAD/FMN reductase [Methyloligella halotolerans]|uniref:NAD(P)H-dependent FAD/FMN reductase n=1 Tax=Methyloligella halotolerans TaxID=1177755 RepID=A0A1E2S3H3_9HYPH|nr:NAD(P)H-dependent oxidoreductase [Methyloligella halotolerans]ODA69066.1 NAD(P)H-dependent FAD/FMN reductase [Methyloligella halotolerans]